MSYDWILQYPHSVPVYGQIKELARTGDYGLVNECIVKYVVKAFKGNEGNAVLVVHFIVRGILTAVHIVYY